MADENVIYENQIVNGPNPSEGDMYLGVVSDAVTDATMIDVDAAGMTQAEHTMLDKCVRTLADRRDNNVKRWTYYLGKDVMKNLGLAFPDGNKIAGKIKPVCGWGAKAVDLLVTRSQLDYFTFDGKDDDEALRRAYDDNDLELSYSQLLVDQCVSGVEFMSVTAGNDEWDVTPIVIATHTSLDATCVWDRRRRRVAYGMVVTDADDDGRPTSLNLITDDAIYTYFRDPFNGRWQRLVTESTVGLPSFVPFPFRPSNIRPLGQSRITPSMMSLIDCAVRETMRSEVASEVYTIPQRYLLGIDPKKLQKGQKAYWMNYFAVGADNNGNVPQAGQFAPPGINDHIQYMRALASQFAGEAGIPLASIGVQAENPSSAEAIHAEREDLIIEAERLNAVNGRALRQVAMLVMAIANGCKVSELDEADRTVKAKFRPVDQPSVSAMSDAILKQVQAIPELGMSDVVLEKLGYDDDDIRRINSNKSKAVAMQMMQQLATTRQTLTAPAQTMTSQYGERHWHHDDE